MKDGPAAVLGAAQDDLADHTHQVPLSALGPGLQQHSQPAFRVPGVEVVLGQVRVRAGPPPGELVELPGPVRLAAERHHGQRRGAHGAGHPIGEEVRVVADVDRRRLPARWGEQKFRGEGPNGPLLGGGEGGVGDGVKAAWSMLPIS
ncbi:hypothetical protein GCM10020367_61580 [Streptomyces sannanensis]|uniref:Uncharacterized protein n=1 Tax=Streptomyces sannanensis TaxID=285536 RepID=A0ABP6SL49_9ACTN